MTGTTDQRFPYRSVLAVCAHPDDESFGLGAVLSTFTELGTATRVLCFTHGEVSTLGETNRDLATVRAAELAAAARLLGVSSVHLLSYTDGALRQVPLEELRREIESLAVADSVDCLLVFDEGGITGHPDHDRATEAALAIAEQRSIPILAWALPMAVTATLNREFNTGFVGREPSEIDLEIEVDRRVQREAISCHASQATDNPVLWRRLELLADTESLRWLTSTKPSS